MIHLFHFLKIFSYLTFCKLFEQDISSLFSHFSLSVCLFFSVPFQVSVHSGRLCMEGEPGAADAQFWVLLAGVILSHTGPLINGAFVGASLRTGLGCWDSNRHTGRKQQWYGLGLWLEAYVTVVRRGDWDVAMDRAFGVDGWLGRRGAGGTMLVHSGRVIQWGRKESRRKGGKQGDEGMLVGSSMEWGCFCFSGKH